jgi:hypothetical protein
MQFSLTADRAAGRGRSHLVRQALAFGARPPADGPELVSDHLVARKSAGFQGSAVDLQRRAVQRQQADELELRVEDGAEARFRLGQGGGAFGDLPFQFIPPRRQSLAGGDQVSDVLMRADDPPRLAAIGRERDGAHGDPA